MANLSTVGPSGPTPTETTALAQVIQVLLRKPDSPAELSLKQAEAIGSALTVLAETLPSVCEKVPGFIAYTSQVLAAAHIKGGGAGTWAQNTKRMETEVRTLLAGRRIR